MAEQSQPKLARRLEEKREHYQEWPRIARILWVSVAVVVTLGGLALIVLPGPAALVIPLGLVMLSFEFAWGRGACSSAGSRRVPRRRRKSRGQAHRGSCSAPPPSSVRSAPSRSPLGCCSCERDRMKVAPKALGARDHAQMPGTLRLVAAIAAQRDRVRDPLAVPSLNWCCGPFVTPRHEVAGSQRPVKLKR